MSAEPDAETLRKELIGLFHYIRRVRLEIAAISRPAGGEHQLDSMSDQLDSIVAATEDATNTIMDKIESNGDVVMKLRELVDGEEAAALLDQLENNHADVFEACAFQDITGQRINKVTKSLTYVESQVHKVINIWGKDAPDAIEVEPEKEETADGKLLEGPQFKGKGMSQDEIDALFD